MLVRYPYKENENVLGNCNSEEESESLEIEEECLIDKETLANILSRLESQHYHEYRPAEASLLFRDGKSHRDTHSSVSYPDWAEDAVDILTEAAEVEEALIENIFKFCSSDTLQIMRLVSTCWKELVERFYIYKESEILGRWKTALPTVTELECGGAVSCLAADAVSVVAGLETGQ